MWGDDKNEQNYISILCDPCGEVARSKSVGIYDVILFGQCGLMIRINI